MKLLDKLLKKRPYCATVIVAAGSGERMQGTDKIMTELGGKPAVMHAITAFEAADRVDEIVLVVRREQVQTMMDLVGQYGLQKVKNIVPGGKTRIISVQNGLKAISRKTTLAAIHDGARPLVTPELIDQTVKTAGRTGAAAPGIPVKDTIKQVDKDGKVLSTPEREQLRAVQTPQVFDKTILLAAWKKATEEGKEYTDDCGAVEALGKVVYLTEGSEENLKLTTPTDLILAERILAGRDRS